MAELVHEKTRGNPFFTLQFLTNLSEEHLLECDAGAALWRWDIERIRAKDFTDNVVDLMIGKLNRLSGETQETLKQLAYLEGGAEAVTLALVQGVSESQLAAALWEAVREGLVLREGSAYSFSTTECSRQPMHSLSRAKEQLYTFESADCWYRG